MNGPLIPAALACALMLFSGFAAEAEVKLRTLPDGTRLLYNDAPSRRPAPLAAPRPEAWPYRDLVRTEAARTGLDPDLVAAVIRVESAYDPNALSHKGAMGLMQLMPETARGLGVSDPWNPAENVRGGAAYLRQMLDRFDGRLEWALAAYNAGPAAVSRYGGVPPYRETRGYVRKVLSAYGRDPGPWTGGGHKVYLTRTADRGLVLSTTRPSGR